LKNAHHFPPYHIDKCPGTNVPGRLSYYTFSRYILVVRKTILQIYLNNTRAKHSNRDTSCQHC
jgi:hypothetical protein